MSKFEYTLPSGEQFVVLGPADATQADADQVFYEQVAAGSVVGFVSGQSLVNTNVELAPNEYSRLVRGTAGVGSNAVNAVLASKSDILNNIVSSVYGDATSVLKKLQGSTGDTSSTINLVSSVIDELNTVTKSANDNYDPSNVDIALIYAMLLAMTRATDIPNLANTPITNPVNQSDVINTIVSTVSPPSIGDLTPTQVAAIMAQIINLVNQSYTEISNEHGIGKYGLRCYQLEKTGYVKPNTSAMYIDNNPSAFVTVMSSPSIWTGLDGIDSLDDLLVSPSIQDKIQISLLQQAYQSLQASGVITSPATAQVNETTAWVYTPSGLQPATDISLMGGSLGLLGQLILSRDTDYATLNSGVVNADSPTNVNLTRNDYTTAESILQKQTSMNVGTIVSNASKFGAEATALWAISGNSTVLNNVLSTTATDTSGTVINQLAGVPSYEVANTNTATNNATNFGSTGLYGVQPTKPATSLVADLNKYGSSAQYALNLVSTNPNGINPSTIAALVTSFTGPGGMSGIGNLALLSKYASGLSGLMSLFGGFFGGATSSTGTTEAVGYSNTVTRSTVNAAATRVIGDPRVSGPVYEYPSSAGLANALNIAYAKGILGSSGGTSSLGAGSDAASLKAKYGG